MTEETPTTDAEMQEIRAYIADFRDNHRNGAYDEWTDGTLLNAFARIDAESARVKVLEEALRRLIEKATADECNWSAELLRAVAVLDGTDMTPSPHDLIERLKRAEGPSRKLDALIHRAITPALADAFADDTGWLVGGDHTKPTRAPLYTGSLDAAFKLIPADWWLAGLQECRTSVRFVNDEHEPTGKWQAAVQHRNGGRLRSAEAKTAALALTIVALKAYQGVPHADWRASDEPE